MRTSEHQPATARLDAGYLEGLFGGARLAIIACEPDGTLLAWNTAAAQLFSHLAPDSEGRAVGTLFGDRDRAVVEDQLRTCTRTREPVEFELQLGARDDGPLSYAVWWTPIVGGAGELRGLSLWFRDITTRVRLKAAVEKRQRLGVLGSLAGAVAHHYNNLLCSIATSLDYASNMNTPSAMRRALQRTADAVTRAADITRQLLVFAQADHRAHDLADVTEVVLQYFDEHEEQLAQRQVRLRLDWHRIPATPVPREQFSIVLDNLVQNAIDAMPNGGTLAAVLAQRDATHVALTLTDSGPGIPPGALEHLFEPFFTTKGVLGSGGARNAGMGLAVVHGFVAEMGGHVIAGNVPGAGARCEVILPIASEP